MLRMASLSIIVALTTITPTHATDTYYTYDGQRIPLSVDPTRIAIQTSADNARAALPSALADAVDSITPHTLSRWSILHLRADATRQIATAQFVDVLANDPRIEFVSPVFISAEGGDVLVPQEVLVGFHDVDDHTQEQLLTNITAGEITVRNWGKIPGFHRVTPNARDGYTVLAMANALAEHPAVRFAEPNFVFTGYGSAFLPDDTHFPDMWSLNNTGQTGGTPDADVDAPEAWDLLFGDPNIFAVVLDIGVQLDHPDLNLTTGADFTDENQPATPLFGGPNNECDNHGTWVAGRIAATINNALGVTGIAPNCPVASARIGISNTPSCNLSWGGQLSWTVDAILWAQSVGARVTNNSNAYNITSSAIRIAYEDTEAAGVVHFASAGNGGFLDITYPASLGSVNAVGAVSDDGLRWEFSNFGASMAFAAPGDDVWSTDRTGPDGKVPDDYATVEGTSFASPIAAGIAALVLSLDNTLDSEDVNQILRRTAVDVPPLGFDSDTGWGLVNARNALELAATYASWLQLAPSGPPELSNHQIVYDTARDRVVLFGGLRIFGFSASNETWEWDNNTWTQVSTAGVSPRYGHGLAYDQARSVTVLYGGFAGASATDETWEWNGATWTPVNVAGPPARFLTAMAYDAGREVTVLFGGRVGGSVNNETWEYDGNAWTLVDNGTGPSARDYHAMAYDPDHGRILLFGGSVDGDELWAWDGASWQLLDAGSGPVARERHGVVYDTDQQQLLVFGGLDTDGDPLTDVWGYKDGQWRMLALRGALPRERLATCYDSLRKHAVLFGGLVDGTRQADTWRWFIRRPEVITPPVDLVVNPGRVAQLDVQAEGLGTLGFQWRRAGTNLSDGGAISGSTTDTLIINGVVPADAGLYDVRVTDLRSTATAGPALLRIRGDADTDGDIDAADTAALYNCLTGPGLTADPACTDAFDFNNDQAIDLTDVAALQPWFTGM
jgi:thermitase